MNTISVVIPVYNEEDSIKILISELDEVIRKLTDVYEIILIDDGSTDKSCHIIRKLLNDFKKLRLIKFKKNCGQSAAFAAGFSAARYEYIVTLDADLQNDPADIPVMFAKINEGYDAVIGWRKKRSDTLLKKISSKIGNSIRNIITGDDIKDTGCSLKVYKKIFLDKIKMYNGMHRFLPTLLKIEGAKITVIPVNHRTRKFGVSKYGVLNRLLNPLFDCFAVRWMKKRHIAYTIEEDTLIVK